MNIRNFFIFLILQFSAISLRALTAPEERFIYSIHKTTEIIQIDGRMDEQIWSKCQVADGFWMSVPYDTAAAQTRTEVRMTYDDKNIYLAAICFDQHPDKAYIIQSLKRDFSYPVSDGFGLYLDPFNDRTNGFAFTCNPYGVQREGLLANSGLFGVSTDWDNRWLVETQILEDRWVLEMAIPFKSIRYKEGVSTWRINFSRNNLKINEGSSWSPVPRTYNIASLLHTGLLVWDQPPGRAGMNVSLIPYVTGSRNEDYVRDTQKDKFNAGGDAKIAVTSSLNLDLTVNPDFSQVEVDRQQTNLSRFSLFFPEKRNFFIENSDLFGQFGFSKIRPFFSRNIGLFQGNTIPILGGARLSGKLDQNWRMGVMNLQTKESTEFNQPGYNFSVAALQRKVFQKSTLGAIFINRQSFKDGKLAYADYHRLGGVDFNYTSKNNLLTGKIFLHHSFDSSSAGDKSATAVFLLFQEKNWTLEYNHEFVGRNYQPVVGYMGYDLGYFRLENRAAYNHYPKGGSLQKHGPELYQSAYWNSGFEEGKRNEFFIGRPLDSQYRLGYYFRWASTSLVSVYYSRWYTFLRRNFDPSGTLGRLLPAATSYDYGNLSISYNSDFRKKVNYRLSGDRGTYFNGDKLTLTGEVNWRIQPIAIISAVVERNEIRLPSPYSNGYHTLFGPKFEFAFSREIFFTTFLQYNTQIDNMNINARLQWRFKPMSDFYIVYTDNYNAVDNSKPESSSAFFIKNRGIVFKLNYWFTL